MFPSSEVEIWQVVLGDGITAGQFHARIQNGYECLQIWIVDNAEGIQATDDEEHERADDVSEAESISFVWFSSVL